jgi:hypothetical protein
VILPIASDSFCIRRRRSDSIFVIFITKKSRICNKEVYNLGNEIKFKMYSKDGSFFIFGKETKWGFRARAVRCVYAGDGVEGGLA